MKPIERRLDAVQAAIPDPTPAPDWDMSLWTDDEVDEMAAIFEKMQAVMAADPRLSNRDAISRALTPTEMERQRYLLELPPAALRHRHQNPRVGRKAGRMTDQARPGRHVAAHDQTYERTETMSTIKPRTTKPVQHETYYSSAFLYGNPAARLRLLQDELAEQRQRMQLEPEGWYRDVATKNVELLQDWIANSRQEQTRREQDERDRVAEATAAKAQAEQAADAKLRDELRPYFMAGNPDAAEADFEQAYPALKERHQVGRMDAAIAQARESGRYRV